MKKLRCNVYWSHQLECKFRDIPGGSIATNGQNGCASRLSLPWICVASLAAPGKKAQKVKLKMKHMMWYVPCWNLHRCGVGTRFPNHFSYTETPLGFVVFTFTPSYAQNSAETRGSHRTSVTVLGLGILRVLMIFRDLPHKYANILYYM